MPITYHIKTNTGKHLNVIAEDAGTACGLALKKAKGALIEECFSGNDEGRIRYEIPKHCAWVKKPKRAKPVQGSLF